MSLPNEQRELIETVVEETLLKLGIDVSTPERVVQFQEDIRYVREWRTSMAEVRRAGLIAAVGTIVTGFIALLIMGVQHWFTRGGT